MKSSKKPDCKTGTYVDTIGFDADTANSWVLPAFQRPLSMNTKVRELAEVIRNDGGVLPGIITFGILGNKHYLIDGQQRRQAFLLSGRDIGYVDARFCKFNTMAEMANEFVTLNQHLVVMKPDDILRGLEPGLPCLQWIRKECPFVGYDMIRRNEKSPVLSMSTILRAWRASSPDTPAGTCPPSSMIAQTMTEEDTKNVADYLTICMKAWGREVVYARLWNMLNLSLCAWLYRRIVLSSYSGKSVRITKDQFCKCLMSLSANENYVDWLLGRKFSNRDRAPCYARIKTMFAKRIDAEIGAGGKKIYLPAPAWAVGGA